MTTASDLDDPVERLRAIHESTLAAKSLQRALRSPQIRSLGEAVPPAFVTMESRTITYSGLEELLDPVTDRR